MGKQPQSSFPPPCRILPPRTLVLSLPHAFATDVPCTHLLHSTVSDFAFLGTQNPSPIPSVRDLLRIDLTKGGYCGGDSAHGLLVRTCSHSPSRPPRTTDWLLDKVERELVRECPKGFQKKKKTATVGPRKDSYSGRRWVDVTGAGRRRHGMTSCQPVRRTHPPSLVVQKKCSCRCCCPLPFPPLVCTPPSQPGFTS